MAFQVLLSGAALLLGTMWLFWDKYFGDLLVVGMIRNFIEMLMMLRDMKGQERQAKKNPNWNFVDYYEGTVDADPDNILFILAEDGSEITRKAIDDESNELAAWAKTLKLKQSDTVALMMFNKPDFFAFWLGMAKVGVSTGLLNTNLLGKSLLHSVELAVKDSSVKVFVIDSELEESLKEEISQLRQSGIQVFGWDAVRAASLKLNCKARPSSTERDKILNTDTLILIYTSGTTGLPKASKISHARYFNGGSMMKVFCYLKRGDRQYCCLPLYHSAGGIIGLSGAIKSGATMVLRKKFSARSFTPDCLKYNCVATQYIGELCRYLLNAPANPDDVKLNLRYALGNGMRPDVWVKFKNRYNVKRIIEFYGATEGNFTLFNSTGRVGALGFLPGFLQKIQPVRLLRVNPEQKDTPLRDENGFCTVCEFGEVGLAVNLVKKTGLGRFEGYTDTSASGKKMLTDVFKKGDMYYNSGDLLSLDRLGFFYWSDRVGDTFRWKGENVATTEVEAVLISVPGVADVTVYGVEIPNCDGRAGMVAMKLQDGQTFQTMDWELYHKECVAHLPIYSRPVFIRIRDQMTVTTTFKHQKNELIKEGFNPDMVNGDSIFMYSPKDGVLSPVDKKMYDSIISGDTKL